MLIFFVMEYISLRLYNRCIEINESDLVFWKFINKMFVLIIGIKCLSILIILYEYLYVYIFIKIV